MKLVSPRSHQVLSDHYDQSMRPEIDSTLAREFWEVEKRQLGQQIELIEREMISLGRGAVKHAPMDDSDSWFGSESRADKTVYVSQGADNEGNDTVRSGYFPVVGF